MATRVRDDAFWGDFPGQRKDLDQIGMVRPVP